MADTHIRLEPGDVLFKEGDDARDVYVISEGTIQIQSETPDGRRVVLAKLGPGDFFGEMAVINRERRSASALAMEYTTLLVYPADEIENLMTDNPAIGARIIRLLAQRLRDTNEKLKAATQGKF